MRQKWLFQRSAAAVWYFPPGFHTILYRASWQENYAFSLDNGVLYNGKNTRSQVRLRQKESVEQQQCVFQKNANALLGASSLSSAKMGESETLFHVTQNIVFFCKMSNSDIVQPILTFLRQTIFQFREMWELICSTWNIIRKEFL